MSVSVLCFIVGALKGILLYYNCLTAISMPSVSINIVAEAFKEGHCQQAVCTGGNSEYTKCVLSVQHIALEVLFSAQHNDQNTDFKVFSVT